MRAGILWAFLPDELLALLLLGAVLALMLGLVTGRTVLSILALIVLLPVLGPLSEAVLGELPAWVSVLILVIIGLALLRAVAALFIGSRAADNMVGALAADAVRLAVLLFLFPLRAAWWLGRAVLNGNGLRHLRG